MNTTKYVEKIRRDFPALATRINGYKLAYLDNAATTQKPFAVIQTLEEYYSDMNANVHRGVHYLSEIATEAYENAREVVKDFINAQSKEECVFVRGTTEAINLVASSFGQKFVKAGDEILLSVMEHHSNIVPWQLLCERTGASIRTIPITEDGELDLSNLDELLNIKTKIVAITHVSNALGTINPIKEIIAKAHARNIPVLIDGAQAGAHLSIDVQDLDCDFYTLSAHKMYGPMGIGILYAKRQWLEAMPPYQGGGDMILQVSFDKVTYNKIPFKFEAGTPAVADAIAWAYAIDYLQDLNRKKLITHERDLMNYAMARLKELPGITFYGTAKQKISIISFNLANIHAHDIGTIVNEYGVAIRTGHHCNMPLMDFYGIAGTARVSIGLYNNIADIDALCESLLKAIEFFTRCKK